MKIGRLILCVLMSVSQLSAADTPTTVQSNAADRQEIAITVYNNDLALLKEQRRVNLPSGLTRLELREVSGEMQAESALLRAIDGPPIVLLEQNFDFDLLTPAKLLEKYLGRQVTVVRSHPTSGEERSEQATVLATNSGVVLRIGERIETGIPGRLVFPSVPENLRDRPTLSVLLQAESGEQTLELSYLSGGLSWKADYVANLSKDANHIDLAGWVTLTNRSGASYQNAKLQLVAGDVNRAPRLRQERTRNMRVMREMAAEMPTQEGLLDYHLYRFERRTSIGNQQTKQLALLNAQQIPVRHEYLLQGSPDIYFRRYQQDKQKPAVYIEFENRGALNRPLPAGIVRVYAKDSQGAAQFVGEDRIAHTAKNETVRLKLGTAFDITAQRTQSEFSKISDQVYETSWRIEVHNAKSKAVTVTLQEALSGDWKIVQASSTVAEKTAQTATWQLSVGAEDKQVLEYRVRIRH